MEQTTTTLWCFSLQIRMEGFPIKCNSINNIRTGVRFSSEILSCLMIYVLKLVFLGDVLIERVLLFEENVTNLPSNDGLVSL